MLGNVSVMSFGNGQYTISQENSFSFRIAIQNCNTYIAIKDIAECCGYLAGGKLVQRLELNKVKILSIPCRTGRRGGRPYWMWYMSLEDSIQFVKERCGNTYFRQWFLVYAKDILDPDKINDSALERPMPTTTTIPPATGQGNGRHQEPQSDTSSIVQRIDRMIAELVTLRQEINLT